jgi:membrane protein DedA with SNARE-associated domain
MESFLSHYGLLALFLCALLENDVAFLLAGVMVHLGLMTPIDGFLAAISGALVHDSAWYALGSSRAAVIKSSRLYRRVGPLVERLADRFGAWELFFCRFIYGTRNPSLVFWGVQHLPRARFAIIEVASLTIWGSALLGLGRFLSERAAALTGAVKSTDHWVLGALGIAAAGFFAVRMFMRHEIKKHLVPRSEE